MEGILVDIVVKGSGHHRMMAVWTEAVTDGERGVKAIMGTMKGRQKEGKS